ncbi:MAG: zinc ribbon domain-containing protein [Promethearchaeota archaeon]
MGFSDLKLLKEREYRLYLILIIWMLIGFTFLQFDVLVIVGIIIFIPLLVVSFIFIINAVLPFKQLRDMSFKRIVITIVVFLLVFLLLINIVFPIIVNLFYLGIISYILITAVFTMYYFYELGKKIDDYLYKLPSKLRHFERWCVFLGGTIFSIILLIGATVISEVATGGTQEAIGFNTAIVAIIIVVIIIIFGIVGALRAIRGRLYAYLGIFFIGIAIYTIYLMISIIFTSLSGGGSSSVGAQILLYFLNLFILLNTIGSLLGEKTELLKEKLKIFNADTILMWLIFSISSFVLASGGSQAEIDLFRLLLVYILFIPLLIIMGLYGFYDYTNIIRERDLTLLEKEAKKEGVIDKSQVICKKCGATNEAAALYCTACGVELK